MLPWESRFCCGQTLYAGRCEIMSILVFLAFAGADPSTSIPVVPVHSVAPSIPHVVKSSRSVESENFIVRSHVQGPDAAEFSRRCESIRLELRKQFFEADDANDWSPKCEVVLHHSRSAYLRAVGNAGSQTSGSSAVGLKSSRVVKRRIDLLADAANQPSMTVRHELVHVIIADLFPDKAPPKWAEEGLALLNDTEEKQHRHQVDLHHANQTNTLIPLRTLLSCAAYPANCQRATFYAQSMALVDHLVERGTPKQFIEFVRVAMANDCDRALKSIYGIDGIRGLSQELEPRPTSIVAVSAN